jgi:hypothetical protein
VGIFRKGKTRAIAVALAALFIWMLAPSFASAHVQVTPSVVAPNDPVLFTVLVPGELDTGTVEVDLKVPKGVFPFSYEATPGWKRRLVLTPAGLTDRIVWTGRAEPDGLVRFSFLAGSPSRQGPIFWKVIQRYGGGEEAAWIGPPGSEFPASETLVSADAPRANAGGEGREAARPSAPGDLSSGSGLTDDWIGRGLGILAILLGGTALFFIVRRGR